jgi:hypothetical protein
MYKLKEPGFLVWSRTMDKYLGNYEQSNPVANLVCYNIGLENKKEKRIYRLYQNGDILDIVPETIVIKSNEK